jgi:hypothetical protein
VKPCTPQQDPVRRATENPAVIRTKSRAIFPLALIKLGWRRWRYKARLRPPLQELLMHTRLVTHHRFLSAQMQRQHIVSRLHARQVSQSVCASSVRFSWYLLAARGVCTRVREYTL